jgi:hypothetical protein
MRRARVATIILMSLGVASAAAGQEPVTVAPLPPPPPPPSPAPPPPPAPPAQVIYTQPPPPPPAREVVYVEEPAPKRHVQEEPESVFDDFSFGMELSSFEFDLGVGGRITTPNLGHFIRITAAGGVAWYPNALLAGQPQDTWDTYYYGRLTLELPGPQLGPVRTYAFAGAILLGLPKDLSSTEINVGGIGGFGFEFLLRRFSAYFLELGALGTGAIADQIMNSPTFANGFLITVGSRFYL